VELLRTLPFRFTRVGLVVAPLRGYASPIRSLVQPPINTFPLKSTALGNRASCIMIPEGRER
jgi:hypothetical protein